MNSIVPVNDIVIKIFSTERANVWNRSTYWGKWHIYGLVYRAVIGSYNGLAPVCRQSVICNRTDFMTKFIKKYPCEILIQSQIFPWENSFDFLSKLF